MEQYAAPLRDMQFVLFELLQVEASLAHMPAHAELDAATIVQVLEEAARFSTEVVAPLNPVGDVQGCTFRDGVVTTPTGFRAAYERYVAGGWPALACAPEHGGQGLPLFLNNALFEMLNAANQAWTMYPGLSHGAYECLHSHGTDVQKQTYLPRLVDGTWTGTMCLTEPHCGTDLGLIRTRARPDGHGAYRLSGTKIFISSGEHDLAENIVHLVLARLPDAPAGTRGISLFIVPKFLTEAAALEMAEAVPGQGGAPGRQDASAQDAGTAQAGGAGRGRDSTPGMWVRNTMACSAIEHKMGIHGNATCVMNLDEAQGWLVGEPHKGLAAMFVMMNAARLGVGMQGLGLTELAYQRSRAYARERLQMRSLSGAKAPEQPADPIIVHPDVRRMLLTQKAYAEGGRAFSYWLALLIDTERTHADAGARADAADLVALLTPVVKAFLTDNACEAANLALQVFGGHGYIRETGVEQIVRDARINTVYEGTNTIQALDLLGRKVLGDMGARMKKFGKLVEAFIDEEGVNPAMQEFIDPLAKLGGQVQQATMELGMKAMANPDEIGAAAVPYLRAVGHLIFAWLWARSARIALAQGNDDPFYRAKLATARFYFARLLPEATTALRVARSGAKPLMELDADLF